MKSTLLVLFSFLLLAFVFTKPSIAADELAATEPVLDIDGEELRAGTEYSILSVGRGAAGGDITATDKTCPLDVIRGSPVLDDSLPVTFTPANSKEVVIRVSDDLNIKFSTKKACKHSSVWKIQKSTNSEIQWFVTTGGVEGNPGCETLPNWFKIEKAEIGYKLVYCPSEICQYYGVLCRDIGTYFENGGRKILSLSDKLQTFLVQFRKVDSSLSSSL